MLIRTNPSSTAHAKPTVSVPTKCAQAMPTRVCASAPPPLRLVAVVSETAVMRSVYTPSVAAGQLHQLIQRASLPNVELHVLPLKRGMHAGQDGAFSILSFPGQLLPDVVYQEHSTGGEQTSVPSVAARLHIRLDELRSQALGPNESLAWLTQLAEKHIQ